MDEKRLSAVLSLVCMAMLAARADGHAIVGDRLFPGTLTFDDPAVADELSGPVLARQKHPAFGGPDVEDISVSGSFSRLIIPGLSIGADTDWTEHDGPGGPSANGIGATHLTLKGQAYEDLEHETMIAASLSWGLGGIGNPDLHAHAYDTIEPGVAFGRGFGDLPDDLAFLRPFGVAGGMVVDLPLTGKSRPAPGAAVASNPVIIHWGFALEYSARYGMSAGEEPVNQFVPLVEFQFDSPLNGGFGTKMAGTVNPGLAYAAETWQLSAEAIVPLNHPGGSPGFRFGVSFFLDDLIPSLFGKPLLQ